MSTKYTYSVTGDTPNGSISVSSLTSEIKSSDISVALDYININSDVCDVWFKDSLSDSYKTILDGIISNHAGIVSGSNLAPTMADGRPLVRADTRPLDTSTYFTMVADTASGIGDGTELRWDFSDPSYTTVSGPATLSNGFEIPADYKAQVFDLNFLDPMYFKDGSIYHFDSPWGQYCCMDIVVPAGSYYPNEHGAIPASALGLGGTQKYAYAYTDQIFYRYVNKHFMYRDCPMGDELNAEGAMIDALPVGWFVRGVIVTPNSDNISKGFAELEAYRHRSVILPGDTP